MTNLIYAFRLTKNEDNAMKLSGYDPRGISKSSLHKKWPCQGIIKSSTIGLPDEASSQLAARLPSRKCLKTGTNRHWNF